MRPATVLAIIGVIGSASAAAGTVGAPKGEPIAVPGGEAGIGYDDLQLAPESKRILVPAGRTGRLVIIDPATKQVTSVSGFSATSSYRGGHGEGTTSASELGAGLVVATDRGTKTVKLVNLKDATIVGSTKLAGPPDYVRSVPLTHEVWVTEPGRKQIEVLRLDQGGSPRLVHVANIEVPDGPESLVIDAARGRAYSHTWTDETYAIDLKERKVVSTWKNGCRGSRGIALDQGRGLLFAGCAEGRATVVNLATAKLVSTAPTGSDVDSIGYAAPLGHLYVPGGGSSDLSIFGVSSDGKLTLLGHAATAADAHTVAFDPATSTAFVGTPEHGVILAIRDGFPSSLR
jgi:DNA-binding beta-propeller fold protein YncE